MLLISGVINNDDDDDDDDDSDTVAAYTDSAVLSSQTQAAYSLGRSPSPWSWTLACSHIAECSPCMSP